MSSFWQRLLILAGHTALLVVQCWTVVPHRPTARGTTIISRPSWCDAPSGRLVTTAIQVTTPPTLENSSNSSDSGASTTTATTTTPLEDIISPDAHGLYKPFADAVWQELLQNHHDAKNWFVPFGEEQVREAPAKGFPPGSIVRMTVRALQAKPQTSTTTTTHNIPVAYARYALLETLVPGPQNCQQDSTSDNSNQHHQGIQVLNCVIIPSTDSTFPVWGADFVALPGGKHLLLLDAQPMMKPQIDSDEDDNDDDDPAQQQQQHAVFDEWYQKYDIAKEWPWAGDLPPKVQQYVSPNALWTRLVAATADKKNENKNNENEINSNQQDPATRIADNLLPVMMEHLRTYLDYLSNSTSSAVDADETETTTAAAAVSPMNLKNTNWIIKEYLEYRLSNDPARPMLQSLYGKEWTENLLETVLFPIDTLFPSADDSGGE